MIENEEKYYDAVMAAYVEGKGRLTFKDRTTLSKERTALGISAAEAMSVEGKVKVDYQQMVEERERQKIEKQEVDASQRMKAEEARLREEAARMAAEQNRKAQELEQRQREEAQAKAEAEEKERKRREEREAMERAETEARRLKAEKEAREDAERLERQEQERRERQEHEETARRVHGFLSALMSFFVGILPLIPMGIWILRNYNSDATHAYIAGGCALFSGIMYVCRFRDFYWIHRWAYILYGLLMAVAIFVWPPISSTVNLPEDYAFLNSPQLPFWISAASTALLCSQTGWFGDSFFASGGLILAGICTAVLVLTGHWGVGAFMGLQLLFIGNQVKDREAYSEVWRWIAFAISMLVSTVFGCEGHWIICSITMSVAACFVVRTDN